MSRKRTIDPDIFTGEGFTSLGVCERLIYLGLWLHCDDEGRMKLSPVEIKHRLLPADPISSEEVAHCLLRIAAARLIVCYERHGKKYLFVRGMMETQRVRWVTHSKLPAPTPDELATCGNHTTTPTVSAGTVTADAPSLAEEMSRDELSRDENNIPPKPPQGGSAPAAPVSSEHSPEAPKKRRVKSGKVPFEQIAIPDDLADLAPWLWKWLGYKRERGEGYTPTGLEGLFATVREAGRESAVEAMKRAISSNHAGFFPRGAAGGTRSQARDPAWPPGFEPVVNGPTIQEYADRHGYARNGDGDWRRKIMPEAEESA